MGTKTPNDAYADKFEYFMLYNAEKEFVGYFSKEIAVDQATEMFALSCLLVMPKFARQGHGTFLIDFSYSAFIMVLNIGFIRFSGEGALHGAIIHVFSSLFA